MGGNKIKNSLEKFFNLSFWVIAVLFIFLSCCLLILHISYAEKFLPRTRILKINAGGKSKEEIQTLLYRRLDQFNQGITFKIGNLERQVQPEDLGIEIDLDQTLDYAFDLGRDFLTWPSAKEKFSFLFFGKNIKLDYTIDEARLENFIKTKLEAQQAQIDFNEEEIEIRLKGKSVEREKLILELNKAISTLSSEPIKVSFSLLKSEISESELQKISDSIKKILSRPKILKFDDQIFEINSDLLKEWLVLDIENTEGEKKLKLSLNSEKVRQFLESLALKINKETKNARFQMENGKLVLLRPEEKGRELAIEENFIELQKMLTLDVQELNLITREKNAEITKELMGDLGIKELIGKGVSNFAGSPKNRIHNIKVASEKLNGLLIKSGEIYSLVENIGEVNAENGYLPELVIREHKTIPEFGGGLCQIATTNFRAAVNAGLPILERESHSYAVSYYDPQGTDATIYIPHPDLKFINDTAGFILLQTKIEGYDLIFEFYGVRDGREVKTEGPFYSDRKSDGSFRARWIQIVKMPNGSERKQTFFSFYDSPAKYH